MKFFALLMLCLLMTPLLIASPPAGKQEEIPAGMSPYFLVLLRNGPKANMPEEEAQKTMGAHLAYLRQLVQTGKIVCVGPTPDGGDIQGISIFQTPNPMEVKTLAEADPAVKAGRFIVEMHSWLGPEGIGKGYAEKAMEKSFQEMEFDSLHIGLLVRGEKWTPEQTPEIQKLQADHLANIYRLAAEGSLIAAGPFTDGGTLRGIFVFTGKSLDEANALAASDPAVKAGRLKIEMHPWMVHKGVFPPVKLD